MPELKECLAAIEDVVKVGFMSSSSMYNIHNAILNFVIFLFVLIFYFIFYTHIHLMHKYVHICNMTTCLINAPARNE